jgi:hypothetical protein
MSRDDAIVAWHEVPPHPNAEGVWSSGVAGVGKASSDISMASLIGANKICAEHVLLYGVVFSWRYPGAPS